MAPSDPRNPDPKLILSAVRQEHAAMLAFLRDIVAIPSPTGGEEAVVQRVRAEMEKVGFDEIKIDPFGNVLGRIGAGRRVLAFDAHLDTVAAGDPEQWSCDPFAGKLEDGRLYGRGAVDQKAGMAALVYAGKLLKRLDLAGPFTIWMVGSVAEEDCDGLCWHYILQEKILAPELVVSTEPTGLRIHRGQRGRMDIRVATGGRSAHGSMPQLGENAIYRLMPAVAAIETLNSQLKSDPFLGKGTCAVTWIGCQTQSLNAIPHRAELHIDRRLTTGETRESALQEIRQALQAAGVEADVRVPVYNAPTWTGLVYPRENYFPTWQVPEDHRAVRAAAQAFTALFGRPPEVASWTFSTNGVAINGLHGVPCLGFGPGLEALAHAPDEYVPANDVAAACAFYAALPEHYAQVPAGS